MRPTAVNLPDLLRVLPAEAREMVQAAWSEAAARLTQDQLSVWLEGARRLAGAGVGMSPLVSYLRTVPGVAKQGGNAVLIHVVATVLSTAACTDGRTADAFLCALPTVAQRLSTSDALLTFLDLVDELAALAPGSLAPMLERVGFLLEQVSVDGLRRWALLGVQGHVSEPGAQEAWFRLESRGARTILRAASEGTLFSEVERRLSLYLRAMWGRSMELRAESSASGSSDASGKKGRRVAIGEGFIRMPQAFDVFPGQEGLTLYRAAAAHAAAHLMYSTHRFPVLSLKPVQVALVSLIEDARVEHLALRAMPGLRKLWQPFHVALPSFTVSAVSLMARLARALLDGHYEDDNPWIVKGRTMFAESLGRMNDPAVSRSIGMLLGNDLGQMRVQFNFKTYLVEPLYRDDNLFMWDFGDAGQAQVEDQEAIYQPVNLTIEEGGAPAEMEMERSGTEAAQPEGVKAEAASPQERQAVDEALAQPYYYHEWDYAIGLDRPAWCTLLEKRAELGNAHEIDEILIRNQRTVNRLTSLIKAAEFQRPVRLRRQVEGDRLDLDASIAATVDRRSGRAPDPRVHERRGKSHRDLAVLLLLDLSLSTNTYVPSADTTVLNLAREATALVADAMDKIGDNFAIHGFDSNGRNDVEYYRLKDFDEPYGERARARLAGMTGQLSTRMGAALRHAGQFLRWRRVANKLVLLVTDGAPHDIDVHDEKYLVFDAKRAVEEQARCGVVIFCISLDPAADNYVRRIFGTRNYLVLDHLRRLPEKLPALYLRLTS